MENKELPSATDTLIAHAKARSIINGSEIPDDDEILDLLKDEEVIAVIKMLEEYAQLVAEYHVRKQAEAIMDNAFHDTSVEPTIYTFDSKNDILNAYKV